MEELITLNQLKEYDEEKTNKIDNRFNNVYDTFNDVNSYVDNGFNVVNSYVDNGFNDVNNTFNELHNNFAVSNFVANDVTISGNISLNESTGFEGQVITFKDGKPQWQPISQTGSFEDLGVTNLVANNAAVRDINVANLVSNNATSNNFNVGNIVADNATSNNFNVSSLVADNATSNNFNVGNIVADNANLNNLNVGSLVVDNATSNNFSVNYLTVNNSENVQMLTANQFNAITAQVDNLTVNNSENVLGDHFTHKGYDVTSMVVMTEADYNNLGGSHRNQAFYITTPNGNMYIHGIKYVPGSIKYEYIAYANLTNFANGNTTLDVSHLTFTTGAVTNSFVNGGGYNGIEVKSPIDNSVKWNNLAPVGTKADDGNVVTNAEWFYITDASNMYAGCTNLTDTFICNPALITNAPDGYDVMKYCTNMFGAFSGCSNFNQPVIIPDSVTNMQWVLQSCANFNSPVTIGNGVTGMREAFRGSRIFNQPVIIPDSVIEMTTAFENCRNFNGPVTIGNSVTNMLGAFSHCFKFNQPVIIPDSVTDMVSTFNNCIVFNSPVTIGNGVTNMRGTFNNCIRFNSPVTIGNGVTSMLMTFHNCANFNQSITIPDSVTDLSSTFRNCTKLRTSTVPIHISSSIALGDTSNYIYNALVNGLTSIAFNPSRILNDA